MLETIAIIVLVIAAALAVLLAYAATRPDTFHIERSANIAAPAEKIFPMISDLHRWEPWSPYEKRDPAMQRSYSGAPSGKGAVYEWNGNKTIGQGRVTIADAVAPSKVRIDLDMIRPFAAHNDVEFTLQPNGHGTKVTWAMEGARPLLPRVICMFFNMDKMVGADFETGLANLKAVAEAG